MITLEELITILQNGPLAFKLAIVVGLVIILIAVVPALSIPILKNSVNLSKKQSMILGTIGFLVILSGLVGLSQIINDPPIVEDVMIIPEKAIALESGTPLTIYVKAKDPDSDNIVKNIFSPVTPLLYDFSFRGPSTGNRLIHAHGPEANNTWIWLVYPAYAGDNIIVVNVTDRPPGDQGIEYISHEYVMPIKEPNQPPKIEKVYADYTSPQRINHRLMISVEATDKENDMIYYRFLRTAPNSTAWSVSQNWSEESEMFWNPNADDIGDNIIRAQVRDEYHGQKGASKDLKFEIINRELSKSTGNSSGDST